MIDTKELNNLIQLFLNFDTRELSKQVILSIGVDSIIDSLVEACINNWYFPDDKVGGGNDLIGCIIVLQNEQIIKAIKGLYYFNKATLRIYVTDDKIRYNNPDSTGRFLNSFWLGCSADIAIITINQFYKDNIIKWLSTNE